MVRSAVASLLCGRKQMGRHVARVALFLAILLDRRQVVALIFLSVLGPPMPNMTGVILIDEWVSVP